MLLRSDSDQYLIKVATASDKVFFPMVRLDHADDSKNEPIKDYPPRFDFTPGPHAIADARVAMQFPLPPLAMTGRVGVINFCRMGTASGAVTTFITMPMAGIFLRCRPK